MSKLLKAIKAAPVAVKTSSSRTVLAAVAKLNPKIAKAIKVEAAEDKAAKTGDKKITAAGKLTMKNGGTARQGVSAMAKTAKELKSSQMKAIAATVQVQRANIKDATTKGSPVTPLTKAFLKAGYVYARTEEVDRDLAHGYTHPDGSAVIFTHAWISKEVGAKWTLRRADGTALEGVTAKDFVTELTKPAVTLPSSVVAALDLLKKASKGLFRLMDFAGDGNYAARVQLLKKLRSTDKVLVKTSGVNQLVKEFYEALNIEKASAAAMAAAFETKCVAYFATTAKATNAVRKVEKEEIAATLAQTAHTRVVGGDGSKPITMPKKLSKKAETADSVKFKAALAARVRNTEEEERVHPVATPRPDASINVSLDDIFILEDPNNGIVMMMLEKPNSQGAICVYNNGSRVAAGVVPTEILNTLRPLTSDDLVRDVNQLLHPITAGVVVTPGAERHLTAVLDRCKEMIPMATTETAVKTKKFEAPKNVAKKATPKTATAKKSAHDKGERAARTPRAAAFADTAVIKVLVKENPFRGTLAERFAHIFTSKKGTYTVADYVKATERYPDLGFFVKKEAISIK